MVQFTHPQTPAPTSCFLVFTMTTSNPLHFHRSSRVSTVLCEVVHSSDSFVSNIVFVLGNTECFRCKLLRMLIPERGRLSQHVWLSRGRLFLHHYITFVIFIYPAVVIILFSSEKVSVSRLPTDACSTTMRLRKQINETRSKS